jgi:putative DNA-invertase from lambdoid prophage Rac
LKSGSKGDTIIASKLDRLFRSARDALNVVEELKAKGVSVHVIDLHGDITNGIAKIFMTITAAFAEMERERISDRLKETKAYLFVTRRFQWWQTTIWL